MDERGRLRRGVKINSLKRKEKKQNRSRQIDDEMMKNSQIKVEEGQIQRASKGTKTW